MTTSSSIKWLLIFVLIAAGCKERFDPKLAPVQTDYLVVEGFINANGATTIKLSRTTPIDVRANQKPELNAEVRISGEDNSSFNVTGRGNGTYTSDSIVLNVNQKYRLQIKTRSGSEYLSEFSSIKRAPPIDSISWKPENNGINISVSTHDQQNKSIYYKWDYEETWELRSAYTYGFEYKPPTVVRRTGDLSKFYYCWNSFKSNNILLGSSAQLTSDIIYQAPITYIPIESEKLAVRYSILIKQYVLDRKGYDFYKMMKSNTESIGSIFDPQPSDLPGNITCVTNPLEKAIGYIAAATMSEKRIFLLAQEVNSKFRRDCKVIYVANNADSIKYYFDGGGLLPFDSDGSPPGPVLGYFASYPTCIDCTLRGSNIKPSFW
jgi:hypothetical protein